MWLDIPLSNNNSDKRKVRSTGKRKAMRSLSPVGHDVDNVISNNYCTVILLVVREDSLLQFRIYAEQNVQEVKGKNHL